MKINWMGEAKYFLKIKNASQKILTNFFVSGVFIKNVIFSLHPPSPTPSQGCAGGGVVVALFSYKQWLWLWL
jgi:hypothetical protein